MGILDSSGEESTSGEENFEAFLGLKNSYRVVPNIRDYVHVAKDELIWLPDGEKTAVSLAGTPRSEEGEQLYRALQSLPDRDAQNLCPAMAQSHLVGGDGDRMVNYI
jgi:hypothetical protein